MFASLLGLAVPVLSPGAVFLASAVVWALSEVDEQGRRWVIAGASLAVAGPLALLGWGALKFGQATAIQGATPREEKTLLVVLLLFLAVPLATWLCDKRMRKHWATGLFAAGNLGVNVPAALVASMALYDDWL